MATTPVAQWALSDAQAAAKADLPPTYEVARKLIEENDSWQSGTLWPGHRTGDGAVDAAILARVLPQFVSDDVAGELVENRSNGLLGQEADITLAPRDGEPGAEAEPDDTAEALLGALADWWDRKRLWEKVGEAVGRVSVGGRGSVRAYVASGNLVNGALPTGKTLAEAFDLIELDAPPATRAVRYTDPLTQRPHAVVLTKVEDQDRAEIWSVDPATKRTVVRVLGAKDGAKVVPLDLKGRLPLAEVRGKRIITPSVVKLQALLNFIMTVTGRTVETAGFLSVHVTNAEPQLLWLETRPTTTEVVKTLKNVAGEDVAWGVRVPPLFGAGILHEWQGLEIPTGPNGEQEIKDPSVTAIDPVDTTPVLDAADSVALRLYKRGKQGHLGLAKIGEASGTAYQQARAQFAADLNGLKGPTEGMVRDLLEVVLAYAGLMSTEAQGVLDRFRVVVTLHPSAGPITADDARLATELRDKRAISQQTMLARVGIEDPAAEQAAIDADPVVRAETWAKMFTALEAAMRVPDMTIEGAAWLLGLTPDQARVLATGQAPPAAGGATGAPTLSAA